MNVKNYSARDGQIVVIDKPADWTSFDVVNKVRRMTGIKKVGHAGTLDPFATGVLLLCLGPATKKASELTSQTKEYRATIAFGKETDSMDLTGKVIAECPLPKLDEESVQQVLKTFVGAQEQEIPAYSAAKFKGKRLYKLAREGKDVPRIFKHVQIDQIVLESLDETTLTITVVCGKGTYIRTLGRDIARKLGTCGHLQTLVRTRIGEYSLEQALTIEAFEKNLKAAEA